MYKTVLLLAFALLLSGCSEALPTGFSVTNRTTDFQSISLDQTDNSDATKLKGSWRLSVDFSKKQKAWSNFGIMKIFIVADESKTVGKITLNPEGNNRLSDLVGRYDQASQRYSLSFETPPDFGSLWSHREFNLELWWQGETLFGIGEELVSSDSRSSTATFLVKAARICIASTDPGCDREDLPSTPNPVFLTIEDVIDANDNSLIDDDEIGTALNLWVRLEEVPGTGGQTISDFKMNELMNLWLTGQKI